MKWHAILELCEKEATCLFISWSMGNFIFRKSLNVESGKRQAVGSHRPPSYKIDRHVD